MVIYPQGEAQKPELLAEVLSTLREQTGFADPVTQELKPGELKDARNKRLGLAPYIEMLKNAKALAQTGVEMVEQVEYAGMTAVLETKPGYVLTLVTYE